MTEIEFKDISQSLTIFKGSPLGVGQEEFVACPIVLNIPRKAALDKGLVWWESWIRDKMETLRAEMREVFDD